MKSRNDTKEKTKGDIAEDYLFNLLRAKISSFYKVYRKVCFKSRTDFEYSESDLVVTSIYGIFVVEVKYWSGRSINGTPQSLCERNFTVVPHNSRMNNFTYLNPFRQNEMHILRLSEELNLEKSKFHNLIYFHKSPWLKDDIRNDPRLALDVPAWIRRKSEELAQNSPDGIISEDELESINEQLTIISEYSELRYRKHRAVQESRKL